MKTLERVATFLAFVAVPGALALGVVGVALWLLRYSRTSTGKTNLPPPSVWDEMVLSSAVVQRMADVATFTNVFRDEEVNEAVGGTPTSRHRHGFAVDFVPRAGWTMDDVETVAHVLKRDGVLRYVLNEGDHIHVELADGWMDAGPRGAVARALRAVGA